VAELPEALIVGVACLEKIRSKYGNASFRLYNLDSGFAYCYFREVLTSFGLGVSEFENVRDIALARLLHVPLSGNRNALTYVLGVTATPESSRRRARVAPEYIVDALIDRASFLQVPAQLLPPTAGWRPMSDHLGWLAGDLGTLFKHRRSIRDFAKRSIPRAQLETIVGCAHEAQISRIAAGGLPIHATLWLSVRGPSGDLPAGIYRWDPSDRTLQQVRQAVPEDEIARTSLQSSLSRAPAILFVTMDFGDAVSRFGARGYREMLSHTGTIAAKALLVGASLGVSGCPWGGVVEVGWGKVLDVDRYSHCPLMGVSLGYPVQ
jgi:SagB-type dehydrogenase family enzyme